MGKASSNKKVARAAGTGGGRTSTTNTPWGYIGLIALIVVAGVALTAFSRSRYESQLSAPPKVNPASVAPKVGGTPWNEGLAVYVCGAFEPSIKAASDPEGLTTAGNGIINIAPKVKAAAGTNATLGEFAKSSGVTLTNTSIKLPGGKTYTNGDKCKGKPARLYVKQYNYAGATVGTVETTAAPDVRLANGALLTVAFVPPAQVGSIPAPSTAIQQRLTRLITPPTTTTTAPASSSTTAGSTSTSTTGGSTSTTAASGKTSRHGAAGSKTKRSTSTTTTTNPTTSPTS